jgi:hypothetical protein
VTPALKFFLHAKFLGEPLSRLIFCCPWNSFVGGAQIAGFMDRENLSYLAEESAMIRSCITACALLLPLTASSTAWGESINERALAFLKSRLGTRVGGGEFAHAISEALRVSGAAFEPPHLQFQASASGNRNSLNCSSG